MREITPFGRPALLLAIAMAALAPGRADAADAAPDVKIENVRVGFGDGLARGGYKVGTWTPVWVDLKAGPAGFSGVLEFTAPDDANTPTTIRRDDIVIPANEMKTFSVYTRPGSRFGEMGARVLDRQSRKVKDSWAGGSIESFGPEMILVLSSGQVPGLTEVKELQKYGSANSNVSRMVVAPLRPRDGFPSRWYGFESADVVVLDTNDPSTLSRLRESSALVDWVFQGGHLVVTVGQNWQSVLDSPLGPLLPGVPTGRIDLNEPGLFDQFAGATTTKPLVPPASGAKVRVTKFEDWEKRGGVPDPTMPPTTPLVLRGPYGFGRVSMIGLDVDQKPFSSWEDKKLFWDKLIDIRGRTGETNGNGPMSGAIFAQQSNELSALLFGSLQRFPGVRLVPFGWVAFFVFLYILLIGPGDYFFLRKVVKRMEMTWVTFPLIVITVSAAAYAAAYYFKGTELRINKVDAVDIDQTTNSVRGWSWLTLFSPQNRDYDVGFAPQPLDIAAPDDPLAAIDAPKKASVAVLSSWFAAPEMNSGGSGAGMGFGNGYAYAPLSEPEELKGVRINIWSTKSFSGRWTSPLNAPLLESDLVPDGPDRLRGTVTNVGRRPMKYAAMFFGRYVYLLNDIAPGATVPLGEPQSLIGYLDGLRHGAGAQGQITHAGGHPRFQNVGVSDDPNSDDDRPDIVRSLMFHRGLGEKGASYPSVALRSMDLTDQLELRRPMLVAEVEGPAAQLRLAGQGGVPKMSQTTVVRVILPLKAGDAPPSKP